MEEQKIIRKMSRVGIFGNVALAAFKLFAGVFGKSGAMASDAVHSLSDVFATLIAYMGVRLSKRQEDAEHPYGHERMECVAALVLAMALAVTGLLIGKGALEQIISGDFSGSEAPGILALVAAVISFRASMAP